MSPAPKTSDTFTQISLFGTGADSRKQITPSRLPENLEWAIEFNMDETKSVVAEVDEIFLR